MTDERSNLITVGRITGVFGIKGWVKVKSFTDPEAGILNYQPWWLKTRHGVKQVAVSAWQQRGNSITVQLKGVEDRTQAEELSRCDIAIDKAALPVLESEDYYWHELVGLTVVSVHAGEARILGKVADMMETGANDVIIVKPDSASIDDRERLVPYVYGLYVKKVNLIDGVIEVDWDPDF